MISFDAADAIRADLECGRIRRALFVRPGRIGDLLFVTPLLRRFRERYPGVAIEMLVSRYARGVLDHNPLVDGIVDFEPKLPRWRRWLEYRRMAQRVTGRGIDLALSFSRRSKEARVLRRAGIPRLQMSDEPTPQAAAALGGLHVVQLLARALEPLGVLAPPGPLEIFSAEAEEREVDRFLRESEIDEREPIAVLHPGCFQARRHKLLTRSPRRSWPLARFGAVARGFRELGLRVVFSGAGAEESRRIQRLARELDFPVALGLGLNIPELAALLRRAALMVTVDTGPMHIAAALKTPLVAIFGPNPESYTGPWGDGPRVVLDKSRRRLSLADDATPSEITADEVLEAAQRLLAPPRKIVFCG